MKYLLDVPVYVVMGEESNMKLTYKEDTYLLDKFFQLRKSELGHGPIDSKFDWMGKLPSFSVAVMESEPTW